MDWWIFAYVYPHNHHSFQDQCSDMSSTLEGSLMHPPSIDLFLVQNSKGTKDKLKVSLRGLRAVEGLGKAVSYQKQSRSQSGVERLSWVIQIKVLRRIKAESVARVRRSQLAELQSYQAANGVRNMLGNTRSSPRVKPKFIGVRVHVWGMLTRCTGLCAIPVENCYNSGPQQTYPEPVCMSFVIWLCCFCS